MQDTALGSEQVLHVDLLHIMHVNFVLFQIIKWLTEWLLNINFTVLFIAGKEYIIWTSVFESVFAAF